MPKRLAETDVAPDAKRQRRRAPDPLAGGLTDPLANHPMGGIQLGAVPSPQAAPPPLAAAPQAPLRGDRIAPIPSTVSGNRGEDRSAVLTGWGVGASVPPTAIPGIDAVTTKGSKLRMEAERASHLSNADMLSQVPPEALLPKVDPSSAGDHSPAASSVNKTKDRSIGVTGRSHSRRGRDATISESAIPTLQFTTDSFTDAEGNRRADVGQAAHTAFTSLRQAHGVGEQDATESTDDLLDGTLRAYSPYNAEGEYAPGDVTLPRTNIFSPDRNTTLHESSKGVDPFVGQAMMNVWYRQQQSAGAAAKASGK